MPQTISKVSHRPAWLVLSLASLAYLTAVSQRSTLGAAAIVATSRFHISGEQLALLAVAQLAVYALLQIPVGVLLDRFGPRVLLAFGALVMSLGQIMVAYAGTFGAAAFGRLAVGFGDAFTFISIIRLINGWFHGKQASRMQQWMGNIGQLGQVISAFPFAFVLHETSWQFAFLTWSSVSAILSVAVWLFVQDDKQGHLEAKRVQTLSAAAKQLVTNVKSPSVRMAFWVHFVIQSPGTVMVLLWGIPFLVSAEKLQRYQASTLLSMFVIVGIAFGFVYGQISAHRPHWRKFLVIILFSLTALAWLLVLSFEGQAPYWALFTLFFLLGISGPGSMLAFDFTKSSVPKIRMGSANGFVNIGGFLASFSMMFLIGFLLDLHHLGVPNEPLYSISGFRFALPVQFFVLAAGLTMFLIEAAKSTKETVKNLE